MFIKDINKLLDMKHLVILVLISSFLIFGCIGIEEIISEPTTFSLNGVIKSVNGDAIPNAKIEMISNKTYFTYSDENGFYKFSNLTQGSYKIRITKEGYKDYNLSFIFYPGSYDWNFTLVKDCLYYEFPTKRDYLVIYGYNGTLYRTELTCDLPYPENSLLNISFDGTKKDIYHIGQNRMVRLSIDNINQKYNSIKFYFLIALNGTNSIKIFERKETTIQEASSLMQNYLGERTTTDVSTGKTKKMIDPNNEEIKMIVTDIKKRVNSDNVWDMARELFIWLKNNTSYFNQGGVDEYVQSPAEMMKSRKGDCDELSYLYISLLRSAGIPSRYVEGFLAKENETRFVRHMWVEFYDGEWVPVEVAGTGKIEDEVNTNFGVERNIHVPIFIDDGTQASFERTGCKYKYYVQKPEISNYAYYTSIPFDEAYIAVCSNGERYITYQKE